MIMGLKSPLIFRLQAKAQESQWYHQSESEGLSIKSSIIQGQK